MAKGAVSSTNPELLRRVTALGDNLAWEEFFRFYDPFIRARCSAYGLDPASVDEACQRVWVELAWRMPRYQYDPGGSFRGWLRRLCHHRTIDLIREGQGREAMPSVDPEWLERRYASHWRGSRDDDDEDDVGPMRFRLLREALAIQEEVRRKVKPARWEAFWRVMIQGQSVSEVAASLGLKYATVYAGVNHVADLLRAEGQSRGIRPGRDDTSGSSRG